MFEKLRQIRKEQNKTGEELSKLLGLKTAGAYLKKENKQVPFLLEEGKKIADFFNMTIDEIFFKNELS